MTPPFSYDRRCVRDLCITDQSQQGPLVVSRRLTLLGSNDIQQTETRGNKSHKSHFYGAKQGLVENLLKGLLDVAQVKFRAADNDSN